MEITPLYFRNQVSRFRSVCVLAAAVMLAALFVNGCTNNANDLNGPFAGSGQTETTSIYGRVLDESGAPLPGVTVTAGSLSATTDSHGLFVIKNASVPKGRAVIITKKAGYFDGARAETPGKNGTTRMELSMMTNTATYTVPSANGGKVTITGSGGASVEFAPGSFTKADGTPYTGTVHVAARYLDPTKNNFYRFFSGDQEAQRTDNSRTFLVSCGVLRVELTGASGEVVKLDPTKPATLTCPKPNNDPKAPNEIQLWSFDESLGLWKEEGKATLNGNFYTGTVTHFTDYNFDYCGVDNGTLEFRIVCNGVPVDGVVATVLGRQVVSGSDGIISIRRVAADGRAVTVEVIAADNGGAFFTNGPVPVTVLPNTTNNAGDISLASDCPAALFGILNDCGDTKIDGLVMISWGNNIRYAYTKDGSFAIGCPPNVDITVDAFDGNGNQASTITVPKLSSGEQRTIGIINICGTNGASYFDITLGSASKGQLICLSADGSRLAAGSYEASAFTIYDTKDGSVLSTIPVQPNTYPNAIQFSLDGKRLMVSDYQGTTIYDVSGSTGTVVSKITASCIAITDDGSKVLGVISHGWQNPSTAGIYNANDGSLIKEINPLNLGDSSGSFGYDRAENAIVYYDQKVGGLFRVWSIDNDNEVRNFAGIGNGYGYGISEDGVTLASTVNYKDFTAYDVKAGSSIQTFATAGSNGTRSGSILVTKSKAYSIESANGASVIRIIDLASATSKIRIPPNASYISDIAASRDESTLAASAGNAIRIWKSK
ncbi:MAG TPA: carboxypeptidase regulatory-like domain-containing protein [Candidatus Kapabacteria bacterium]|nr:carboxypeptidase regulatory-like domain-containing protein [Candidatus Kapabacteria bacterium]